MVARRLVLAIAVFAAFPGLPVRPLSAADALPIRETPSPSLPQATRSARWAVVYLPADLFRPLVEQPIDENLPVDEEILGVRATGQARVIGQPKLILTEDSQAAALQIELSGTIHSQTVGRKGPATLYGHSNATFTASKRVVFDPARGFVGQPSQATVQTDQTTDRIETRRRGPLGRVIERVAWSRVADSREEVQAIVKERTERKVRAEFDRILDQRLARVNRMATWRHPVLWMLGSSGEPQYVCRTSEVGLQIAVALDPHEVSSSFPQIDLGSHADRNRSVQVWLHEEAVHDRVNVGLRWLEVASRWMRSGDSRSSPVEFATRREWLVWQFGKPRKNSATAELADSR
jgi:hypothetical protein